MKQKILAAILLVAVIGAYVGYTMYNKPVAATADKKTDLQIEAPTLFAEFEQNEEAANAKYNDKTIEVKGILKAVEQEGDKITLQLQAGEMGGISCEMQDKSGADALKPGDTVTVKGVCTGMLMDVVLVRCVLSK
ncbi:MAG TPA: hypothetical protein PK239_01340 [Chitinophagales bacterium]|nr:hypothetical protein [Chitinophagales bacterium]HRK25909.1 hypothetical protein [Chitinophagales bacterium]